MKTWIGAALLSVCVLSAQTPNFSGVWKLNAEKSKMNGMPAPSSYLMIVDQQATKLSETIGVTTPRGEQRSSLNFNLDKPSTNVVNGVYQRTQASWDGPTLVLASKIAAKQPGTGTTKVSLSPDGQMLTINMATSVDGRDTQQTLVFDKAPDSAADALRKPEQTAGEHYKNVKILNAMPASHLIEAMRSFNLALGTNCEFCHVQGDFASDQKEHKLMARKMIAMTHNINQTTFEGKNEVNCFTCHKGQGHPASHPPFEAPAAH